MQDNKMTRREKKYLIRIAVAFALFAAVFAADKAIGLQYVFPGSAGWLFPFGLYLAIYIFIGYDVLWKAVRNIAHGQVFDENFLMCVATLGAFALAIWRGVGGEDVEGFDEACAVLLFYQTGEFFQRYATGKSRRSISELMDIRPDYANVLRGGEETAVNPEEVEIGETIFVNPGEKVPLDGVIVKGATTVDVKALTGESVPVGLGEGDGVISGSVNLAARVEIRVVRKFYDSTVAKILDMVENAASRKSKTESFITRFARYYTPAVVFSALAIAVFPPIFTGGWQTWIYRALSFLVVSCPCALVISIPLSFVAGIGAASRKGILVKGSDYIEKMSRADVFVFDKTGTLTKGDFAVTAVFPEERRGEILSCAYIAEKHSSHPIALSVCAAAEREGAAFADGYDLTDVAGRGVKARKGGSEIVCGNYAMMEESGVSCEKVSAAGTCVYVAKDGEFLGTITISDEIKPESAEVVRKLNELGSKTVMLTGDGAEVAAKVAKEVGLSTYRAGLLPQDKVAEVERLLSEKSEKSALCFVGDGINDAPVLTRADVGVAMGGVGSDAAIEASDVVLMKDDLRGIPLAKKISAKTMRIVRENVLFSLGVKAAILVLSALGIANMWIAVFGDVGVAVIAILNAMRAGRTAE